MAANNCLNPILWIVTATYWTHSTTVCVLMVALSHLWLPAYPFLCAIYDITVAVKKLLKIQQC